MFSLMLYVPLFIVKGNENIISDEILYCPVDKTPRASQSSEPYSSTCM